MRGVVRGMPESTTGNRLAGRACGRTPITRLTSADAREGGAETGPGARRDPASREGGPCRHATSESVCSHVTEPARASFAPAWKRLAASSSSMISLT